MYSSSFGRGIGLPLSPSHPLTFEDLSADDVLCSPAPLDLDHPKDSVCIRDWFVIADGRTIYLKVKSYRGGNETFVRTKTETRRRLVGLRRRKARTPLCFFAEEMSSLSLYRFNKQRISLSFRWVRPAVLTADVVDLSKTTK